MYSLYHKVFHDQFECTNDTNFVYPIIQFTLYNSMYMYKLHPKVHACTTV